MKVVFLARGQWAAYYDDLARALPCPFAMIEDWSLGAVLAHGPTVVVSVHAIPSELRTLIPALRARGIWTIQLQDGIVEWRHAFANARSPAAHGRFRPLLYDDLVVFGPLWQRVIEWLHPDNVGRCHPLGCPRWDRLSPLDRTPAPGPHARILIASARTPILDDAQRATVVRAYRDVMDHLDARGEVDIRWRVAPELAQALGVDTTATEADTLPKELAEADLVISGHSTLLLEAMAMGIPTVLLDYFSCPNFLRLAWEVRSRDDVEPVMASALEPHAETLRWQRGLFDDAVANHGQASERTAQFIMEGPAKRAHLLRQ